MDSKERRQGGELCPIKHHKVVLTRPLGCHQTHAFVSTSSAHRFKVIARAYNPSSASSPSQSYQSVRDDSHSGPFLSGGRILSQLYQFGRLCSSALPTRATIGNASLHYPLSACRRGPLSAASGYLHRTQRHQAREHPHPPKDPSCPHFGLWLGNSFQW